MGQEDRMMETGTIGLLHKASLALVLGSCLCSVADAAGPQWADYRTIDIGTQSEPGRTGQWWCDNHFGGNLGGKWECAENTGSSCELQVPNNTHVSCGRLNDDGTTGFIPYGNSQPTLGYGRIDRVLVQYSAPGRTGKWWCDNHFGANLGGNWQCRSVSGGNSCDATVPNQELVSCSQYSDVQTVNIGGLNAPGRTGEWWCTNHFGGNLGGNWNCLSVSGGASCSGDVASNAVVSCGRYSKVDETAFEPLACSSNKLDAAGQEFCAGTEYMTQRKQSTLYLYNDYVRAGLNRSFGGTLFELYGSDKLNRIQEHGGAAVQLSLWGYDQAARGAAYFRTQQCDVTPYSDAAACKLKNGGADCSFAPTSGAQVSDCVHEKACPGWSAASPWNPLQAQGVECANGGWNGSTNDVDLVTADNSGVSLIDSAPYQFTKTTSLSGLTWKVNGLVTDGPYVRLQYSLDYTGPWTFGEHNQEMPAIFTNNKISYWFYYYSGNLPYSDAGTPVTRLRFDFGKGSELLLPNRSAPLPLPRPSRSQVATEDWMTVCDKFEKQCLTLVTFSPEIKTFAMDKDYVTAAGRTSITDLDGKTWSVYLFPYRFDDVVGGKSIRNWIYQLKTGTIQ